MYLYVCIYTQSVYIYVYIYICIYVHTKCAYIYVCTHKVCIYVCTHKVCVCVYILCYFILPSTLHLHFLHCPCLHPVQCCLREKPTTKQIPCML